MRGTALLVWSVVTFGRIFGVAGLIDCADIVDDESFSSGNCDNKWKNLKPLLRPTQADVGYAWVQRKLDKDFSKSSDAQDEMDDSPIPAVLGPGNYLYIVDHHHTLVALDKSGYKDTKVTVEVLCDYRDMELDDFWSTMLSENFVYNLSRQSSENGLPVVVDFDYLPDTFSHKVFGDDRYRSLGSFVRKVKNDTCADDFGLDDDCMRCYIRSCDDAGSSIPYFEYRWAYFFNDALLNPELWDSKDQYSEFYGAFKDADFGDIGDIDIKGWETAAELLIPLCRGNSANSYSLPTGLFPAPESLPGIANGWEPLNSPDPECAMISCTL